MKTIRYILLLITAFISFSIDAQTIAFYKNGSIIQEYNASEVDSVVYIPTPSIESNGNVLIGEIRLGAPLADGVDASDVASVWTPEIIQKNFEEGFLFEKDYKDYVSVVRSSTEVDGYLDIDYTTFNYFLPYGDTKVDWNGNDGQYTYQIVMIPSELSDTYRGVWGNDITMTGKSFAFPQPGGKIGLEDKKVTINSINYSVYGYFINKKGAGQYCLTMIKK